MTISRLLSESTALLAAARMEDPAFEAGLILSRALGKATSYVYAHSDEEVEPSSRDRFEKMLERRLRGEPFSYITGESEFMSLKFKVNPHVLIPRSDTEILAEAALYALGCDMPFTGANMFRLESQAAGSRRVLDIGTGSGCLAVSIARYSKNAVVDALDISADALSVARENAESSGVMSQIRFINADFLTNEDFYGAPYDLVISNPPYISESEKPGLEPSVREYEPHLALFSGNNGLAFYERIALTAENMLAKGGVIAVECGYKQAGAVAEIFSSYGLDTTVLKDLSGISRVISARRHV